MSMASKSLFCSPLQHPSSSTLRLALSPIPKVLLYPQRQKRRSLHDSQNLSTLTTTTSSSDKLLSPIPATLPPQGAPPPPLSSLPLHALLRSYFITSLSASPILLSPSLRLLSLLAHSSSPLLSPDRNTLLHWLLKKTFYAQFCAGETPKEVKRTVDGLKEMGYQGVILGYAKEVVLDGQSENPGQANPNEDINDWRDGTLETVKLAVKGDYVALKFTGAGSQALHDLAHQLPPKKTLEEAITKICDLAKEKQVRLLFDAEQQAVQSGIDAWTLEYQRRYNRDSHGQALVYGTYQAYLRSTPKVLANHLAVAADEGFTYGVKLVRGAYLGSDPRHLFWSRKEDTDMVYNSIARSLLRRRYGDVLLSQDEKERRFPEVNVVLASHNLASVQKAMEARKHQLGNERVHMVYAQLMGMADHVGGELIQARRTANEKQTDLPSAYKYLVWGTVTECLKYLLRRAEENRDAVIRTEESKKALRVELSRRLFGASVAPAK